MTRAYGIVLVGICIAASLARADEQADLSKLRQRITALQQNLEKTSESKSEAADALRASERAISNSNREIADLSQQQIAATHDLSHLQQQSAQLQQVVQSQQKRLTDLLYRQYTEGQQEYLQLLLNNRNPNQVARDLQYYEYISRGQAAWLVKLRHNLARLDELVQQSRKKSLEIADLQHNQRVQRQQLEQERKNRQSTLLRISTRLKQQNREMGRLQRNEKHLTKLVEQLAQMFDNSNSSFASLKGKLPVPVKGKLSNRFGVRRPDGTALWKGWFFRAPDGRDIRAIAPGRVVFADWLRGFGNLLIIDHGKGYMSLYGDAETLYKQVGDTLRGGDVIATVGNSGGNENYGLYFELRHEGIPLDPAHWIAKR